MHDVQQTQNTTYIKPMTEWHSGSSQAIDYRSASTGS